MSAVVRPGASQSFPTTYRADITNAAVPLGAGQVLEAQVLEAGRPVPLGMDAAHDGRCVSPAGASLPAHNVTTTRYATVAFRCDILVEGPWTLAFQLDIGGVTQSLFAPFAAASARPSVPAGSGTSSLAQAPGPR